MGILFKRVHEKGWPSFSSSPTSYFRYLSSLHNRLPFAPIQPHIYTYSLVARRVTSRRVVSYCSLYSLYRFPLRETRRLAASFFPLFRLRRVLRSKEPGHRAVLSTHVVSPRAVSPFSTIRKFPTIYWNVDGRAVWERMCRSLEHLKPLQETPRAFILEIIFLMSILSL